MSAPQGPPESSPPPSSPPSGTNAPGPNPSGPHPSGANAPGPNPPEPQQYAGSPSPQTYGPASYAPAAKPPRVVEGPEIGLPPGIAIAELGPRLLAWVVDASVPLVLTLLRLIIGAARGQDVPAAVGVIFSLLSLGWFVFVWWGYATKAAGPGAQVAKLQLVGLADGRPVGWGRFLIRALIFGVAGVFFPVLIALLVIMLRQPRRQGWHDLAVGSVLIKARPLPPHPSAPGSDERHDQPAVSDEHPGAPTGGPRADAEPTVGIPASYGAQPAETQRGYGPPAAAGGYGGPPSPYGGQPGPYGGQPSPYGGGQPNPYGGQPSPYGTQPNPNGPPPSTGPAAHYGPVSRFGAPSSASPSGPPAPSPASATPPPAPPAPALTPPVPTPGQARAREDDAVDAAPPSAPVPTRPAAPVPGGWRLELDGRAITVERLVLLGRNPQRGPGEEDAEIVKVKDEARTVSKTHVAIGVDEGGLFVSDRGSTNGSAVTDPDGVYRLLRADERVHIDAGWVVAFGSHEVRVSRAD